MCCMVKTCECVNEVYWDFGEIGNPVPPDSLNCQSRLHRETIVAIRHLWVVAWILFIHFLILSWDCCSIVVINIEGSKNQRLVESKSVRSINWANKSSKKKNKKQSKNTRITPILYTTSGMWFLAEKRCAWTNIQQLYCSAVHPNLARETMASIQFVLQPLPGSDEQYLDR